MLERCLSILHCSCKHLGRNCKNERHDDRIVDRGVDGSPPVTQPIPQPNDLTVVEIAKPALSLAQPR
jgi:hypothetical protein